ncbi:MAG: hypothetical protein PF636_01345 [Actinomycetota bacterium]|nr:hypothetical protein [Actinomycetota bacterium]
MVDQMTPMPPQDVPVPGDPANSAAGSQGKRVVIIVIAVIAFLVVAAVAAWAFTSFFGTSADDGVEPMVTQSDTSSTESSAEEKYVPSSPKPVELKSVFTFRPIFTPLAFPPEEPEVGTTTGTDGGTTTVVTSGTLYLRAILVFDDGHSEADFLYGDTNYVLAVGERIPDTPWEVLSIGTNSVVMLYGDTQVTLIAGQTITK